MVMPYRDSDFRFAELAVRSDIPFPHLIFGENALLSSAAVGELVETFPDILAPSRRLSGGDKTYATNTIRVHLSGTWQVPVGQLPPCWRDFLLYLADSSYRDDLARSVGVSGPIDLELRLTEYPAGGWMSRHTDRPDKLFSHNIYLCPGWLSEWGGGLALYDSASTSEPSAVYLPGDGTSLAFARSDRSWHEVMPVSGHAVLPRRAVLVHGYRRPAS
jgi:hypothetical protein